jgi:adenylate kinase
MMLIDKGVKLDAVIEIKADADELVRRVNQRAKESGTARPDDNEEVLRKRLNVYKEQTAPLVAYYAEEGLLRTVDGMEPVEQVTAAIKAAIAH